MVNEVSRQVYESVSNPTQTTLSKQFETMLTVQISYAYHQIALAGSSCRGLSRLSLFVGRCSAQWTNCARLDDIICGVLDGEALQQMRTMHAVVRLDPQFVKR